MRAAIETASAGLLQRYREIRSSSLDWLNYLTAEDCCVQAMPDASPFKWHLAHTSWFFETFVLAQHENNFQSFHPAYRALFNSYYNGIGARHPRAQRGMLARPTLAQVLDYRRDVDRRMLSLLEQKDDLGAIVELGLQHEQQHQELMQTDTKALFALNPLQPAVLPAAPSPKSVPQKIEWLACSGGLTSAGHSEAGFCFDNELPSHTVFLQEFSIASRLVSNADYLAFVEDGGYEKPALWLAEGWDAVQAGSLRMPLYWRKDGEQWKEFTLHGLQHLALSQPVSHLSLHEADAFARWSGARLPTEFEWEHAARTHRKNLHGLYGCCWQWTSSSYAPYPGFVEAAGALGEYNGKFMLNQYVLRGSSSATPAGHSRVSYRNFFPAHARWQVTGLRLARDADKK